MLNTSLWTIVDPVGDGTVELAGSGTIDAHLLLSVPQGSVHNAWSGGNQTVRLMQMASDEDMQLEVKFESVPTERYQFQGIIVEQDADNYLRYEFVNSTTSVIICSILINI